MRSNAGRCLPRPSMGEPPRTKGAFGAADGSPVAPPPSEGKLPSSARLRRGVGRAVRAVGKGAKPGFAKDLVEVEADPVAAYGFQNLGWLSTYNKTSNYMTIRRCTVVQGSTLPGRLSW